MIAFNPTTFIRDYWQKKPYVIRQAIPDFVDIVDENELAGLAMEAELDSRIISFKDNQWHIYQGPFENFAVCEGRWTLLVQGVDKVLDEASEIMDWFNFIPNWRIDDLMISYAVEGAGVGAHVDQYDVFLLQGKGSRRWRVGEPEGLKATQPTAGLHQVEDFTPIIDCELLPGDILYIPPGWPHDGTTLNSALTYSIGFRAPEQSQLAGYLAEHLLSSEKTTLRYTDPALSATNNPLLLDTEALCKLKSLIHSAVDDKDFTMSMLIAISDQGLEPLPPEKEIDVESLQTHFEHEGALYKLPGCRPIMTPEFPNTLFINGEKLSIPGESVDLIAELITKPEVCRSDMESISEKLDIFYTFTRLVNMGYWCI